MNGELGKMLRSLRPWRLRALYLFFRPHLVEHRWRMVGALALSALTTLFVLLQPWPFKILFDGILLDETTGVGAAPFMSFFAQNRVRGTLLVALAIFLIAIGRCVSDYHQTLLTKHIGQRVVTVLRMRLFEHIQRLSLAFHTRSQSGDLLMRLTGDINQLRDLSVGILLSFVTSVLVIVPAVVLMALVDWQVTLLVLSIFPATALISFLTGLRIRRAAHRQRRKESQVSVAAHEALLSMPIIQAYLREDSAQRVLDRQTRGSFREGMRVARLESLASQGTEIVLAVGTMIVVIFGVRGVLADPPTLTPGDLLLFYFYLRILNRPVRGFARLVSRAAKAAASAERVMEILMVDPDISDAPDAAPAPRLTGLIEFRGVSFSHDGTRVLRHIDLTLRPGEKVAIVGPSGSGKSTLCGLVPRFHDPCEGAVLLDGVDLRRFTLRSLRRQIGIALQDPMLFGGTVFENLTFGRPDATLEEVQRAARRAQAHGFIASMPEGYETEIAERGLTLSQGQRQRLSLARCFLKRSRILILDEPTSNVDARSERRIIRAIRKLPRDTTCIVVTHSERLLEHVDRIVCLERGEITSVRTPEELAEARVPLEEWGTAEREGSRALDGR